VSASEGDDAVLFDRDGTLVVDVPYNGDPGRVARARRGEVEAAPEVSPDLLAVVGKVLR
jgi:D-glycero-D-manno-heptose 1,7-bisphosphate phosphatase